MKTTTSFPKAINPEMVGAYPLEVFSGGGYFYDDVLEYRVWAKEDGRLVCNSFETYTDAEEFCKAHPGSERPLVLVRQNEYVDEQEPGEYVHVKRERLAEWKPSWLKGNKGTTEKIPKFFRERLK